MNYKKYRKQLDYKKKITRKKIEIDRFMTTGKKWNERPNVSKRNAVWSRCPANVKE